MKTNIAIAFLYCISFHSYGYDIQRVEIVSENIDKKLHATIVLPDSYNKEDKKYSAVYLLHGWSGNDKNWTENSQVAILADEYQLIIVMPDGDYDKWYINSPVLSRSNYEKYIGVDVPSFIDKHFKTISAKNGRAITGLSMG